MTGQVDVARLHFAFTIMFHYLFPVLTIGLGVLIATMKTIHLFKKKEEYGIAARFWGKIFAITFAMGVVTGIPMEFQFGTNWADFSHFTGGVIGQTLFMEGVFAFFAESSFLGLFLFGEKRLSPVMHWFSSIMVAFGAVLSGFFIVATNAWMQNPVGHQIVEGRAELISIWTLLGNPWLWWQYPHVISGSMVTASLVVSGVGAYYLLSGTHRELGMTNLKVGIIAGVIFSIVVAFPTGSKNGENVARYQPIKMAAMEGIFETTERAGLIIIGMPDVEGRRVIDAIEVPAILSYLAYGDPRAVVVGLNDFPEELHPPVEIVYYAYHIMVGLGTIFIAIFITGVVLLKRRRLQDSRWFLWIAMLAMPFGYIANHAGWTVAEVGRQPWVVYGLMRTVDGVSPNVTGGMVWFTLLGFMGLYALLGLLYLFLFARIVGGGPKAGFGRPDNNNHKAPDAAAEGAA